MQFEPRHRPLDLRTRKRIAAMQRIQQVALDLFDAHGYDAATIAQVAEAADVGERSIYRYFGTKPMLVLHDEVDQTTIDVFADRVRREPLLDAVHATLDAVEPMLTNDATAYIWRRLHLVHQHRELQTAVADYTDQLGDALGAAVADARDQPADDLSSRIHGRSIVTALAVAVDHWYRRDDRGPLIDELHRAVDSLITLSDLRHPAG